VIFIDANILAYAADKDAPQHRRAKSWLETALAGTETMRIWWTVLLSFPRLFRNPMPLAALALEHRAEHGAIR
jgi:predicted nucleic acid-binding protein